MSSVDNRIVKMQFENGSFQKNATETIGTLDRLKQALNLTGASKGLEGISAAAASVNLGHLSEGAENANNSFSVFGAAAAVVLGNIATKAIETGAQVAKAFVLDPVLQGFQEYELKMNSIQTMMMSTGEPLERVNQKLNELNTYADKTIYSFSDMTSNIGKFTNAGVSLDASVAAIQGVANVAALSGANATEASHAMYNFGQALSSGAVRLVDWKSIEVANMATVEFKNELIQTALEMGTLVQQGDRYISTTTDLNGKVSDAFNATQMFNDSLSSQWMTSEVLTATLGRYADETTEIGKKAFKAATQVKTFSQLIDTTKEAIGTGWADAFEIVIGNFEEARDLWTSVANVTGDVIDRQAKARQEMLQTWKDLGGRTNLIQGLSNVFHSLGAVMNAIGDAWKSVFPPMTGTKLALLTQQFLKFTETLKPSESLLNAIRNVFTGLFSVISFGIKVVSPFVSIALKLVGVFVQLVGVVLRILSPIGAFIGFLNNAVLSTTHLNQATRLIKSAFEALLSPIKKFGSLFEPVFGKASEIVDDFGRKASQMYAKVFNAVKRFDLEDAVGSITNVLKTIGMAFAGLGAIIGSGLQSLGTWVSGQSWFQEFIQSLDTYRDNINSKLTDFANVLSERKNEIGEALSSLFKNINTMDASDWSEAFEVLSSRFRETVDDLKFKMEGFKAWIGSLEFPELSSILDGMAKPFKSLSDTIQKALANTPSVVQNAFTLIGTAIKGGASIIAGGFMLVIEGITTLWESAGGTITDFIREIGNLVGDGFDYIFDKISLASDILKDLLEPFFDLLKNRQFGSNLETGIFGIIALGIKHLLDALSEFTKEGAGVLKGVTKVLDGVRGCLEAYQKSLKAETLMTIAKAIGILAASIFVLALVPSDQLMTGVTAISAAAVELMVAMKILSKILDKSKFEGVGKVSAAMLALAASTAILGLALKSLSGLEWEELGVGLTGVTVLIGELIATSLILSKHEAKFPKGVFSLLLFAMAIKEMGKAVTELSGLDTRNAVLGLTTVGLLTAALAAFVRVAKVSQLKMENGIAIAAIATAIKIMASSVESLGSLNLNQLQKGLASMGIALAEIALAARVMSGLGSMGNIGITFVALGVAMLEFSAVIAILGSMQLETVAQGMIALGVALAELALASNAMKGTLGASAAVLAMATALLILTPVIAVLGSLPLAVIATGLGTIAAAFTIMGVAGYLLAPVAPIIALLAGSLLLLSMSVIVAGAGLIAFGTGLAAVAAGIVAFAAISSAAINGFLVALEALISGILRTIANVAEDVAQAAASIVTALANAIIQAAPAVMTAAFTLISLLVQGITELLPQLAELGVQIVVSLLEAISSHAYEIADAGIELVTNLANAISDNLDPLLQAASNLVISLINGIANALRENVGPLMDALKNLWSSLVESILEIVASLLEDLPGIGDAAAEKVREAKEKIRSELAPESMSQIGSDAVNGLNSGIQSGSETTTQTALQLGSNVKSKISEAVGDLYPVGSGKISDFCGGMESMSGAAFGSGALVGNSSVYGLESIAGMFPADGTLDGSEFASALAATSGEAQSAGDEIGTSASQAVDSHVPEFNPMGNEAGAQWAGGISSKSGDAQSAGNTIGASAVSGASAHVGTFQTLGAQAGDGFAAGIAGKIQAVATAAGDMVRSAIAAAKEAQDSNSPSKEFGKLGGDAGDGLIVGYRNKEGEVQNAASNMVEGSLNGVGAAINAALRAIENTNDYTPTITPVVDMSQVSASAGQISNLLDREESVRIAAKVSSTTNNREEYNERLLQDFSKVFANRDKSFADGLKELRSDLAKMVDEMSRLKIVMDTGILVGQLSGAIDNRLGRQMNYVERGMA